MAEVDDLYQQISDAKAIETAVADLGGNAQTAADFKEAMLSNPSSVAITAFQMWLVALAMYTQQVLWRVFKSETIELALDGHFGTRRWWVAKALKFQYGYDLSFTDKDGIYTAIDEAAQIVEQAAVDESAFRVIVKVVRLNGDLYTKLTADQLLAFQDYCDELAPAGIKVEARSVDPDRLKLKGKIICDAMQGVPVIKSEVELAIDKYLISLDFNGVFNITKLKAVILAVPGVEDVQLDTIEGRTSAQSNFVPITRVRRTFAGYMKIDSSFPLNSNLQYLSSNV
jgi:hypothetical protein